FPTQALFTGCLFNFNSATLAQMAANATEKINSRYQVLDFYMVLSIQGMSLLLIVRPTSLRPDAFFLKITPLGSSFSKDIWR
ncbi:MAG: hypothetical protein AAGM36_16200, partial [Cyanobacteria bacterium J06597_1]